jgi:hypothetical protein
MIIYNGLRIQEQEPWWHKGGTAMIGKATMMTSMPTTINIPNQCPMPPRPGQQPQPSDPVPVYLWMALGGCRGEAGGLWNMVPGKHLLTATHPMSLTATRTRDYHQHDAMTAYVDNSLAPMPVSRCS